MQRVLNDMCVGVCICGDFLLLSLLAVAFPKGVGNTDESIPLFGNVSKSLYIVEKRLEISSISFKEKQPPTTTNIEKKENTLERGKMQRLMIIMMLMIRKQNTSEEVEVDENEEEEGHFLDQESLMM